MPPPPPATIAFLASGIEGIKVRVTVRADDETAAAALLDAEEREIRRVLADAAGDVVFGIDDEAIEDAVARVLTASGLTLGLAESLTGGLAASRLVNVTGASRVVPRVGRLVRLGGQVRRAGGAGGSGGVRAGGAGDGRRCPPRPRIRRRPVHHRGGRPDPQDGQPPGTVFVGLARPGGDTESFAFKVPGDRDRVRQYATIAALDLLRRQVDGPNPT